MSDPEGQGVHHDGDVPAEADEERRPLEERPDADDDDIETGDGQSPA
jgi:hypothetical protein